MLTELDDNHLPYLSGKWGVQGTIKPNIFTDLLGFPQPGKMGRGLAGVGAGGAGGPNEEPGAGTAPLADVAHRSGRTPETMERHCPAEGRGQGSVDGWKAAWGTG